MPRAPRAGSRVRGRRRGPSGSPSIAGGVRSPPFDLYNTAAAGILAGLGRCAPRILPSRAVRSSGRRSDGDQRAGRTTGRAGTARRPRPARGGVLRRPAGPGRPRPAGRVRDVRPPRLVAQGRLQRGAHRGDDRGDLPVPRRPGNRRAAVHRARPACPVRAGFRDGPARPRGPRRGRPGRRRRRLYADAGHLARDPGPQPGPAGREGRLADGIVVTPSHNPPEDGGFKYNPPNGGPADTDVTGWIQDEANRLLEAGLDGVRQVAARGGARGRDRSRLPGRLRRRPRVGHRHGRDPCVRAAARGGSAGRCERRLLAGHRRTLRPGPDGHQHDGGPAVRVHDLRLGRPDPDGPVVTVRDGPPRRAARPVRRRVRQRHRRRPPRHRHARGRAAQPEPFPGRRGRPPVRRRPRLGRRRGGRQDPRLERDARPRGRRPRPPPARGPGRLQVVRVRTGRRQPRVRWRGECRDVVPAPRWDGLDDRQGRHHRVPAGGRDDCPERPRPGCDLCRA